MESKNNFYWLAIVVFIIGVSILGGYKLTMHKLQRDYVPGPFQPGIDQDKLPEVKKEVIFKFDNAEQNVDVASWRKDWEIARFKN